jgi:succinate dehydrogenase flavin-adding protein (antitoxin of CptAB toxin-antitoxin module)
MSCPECKVWAESRKDFETPESREAMAQYKHKTSLRGLIEALQIIEKYTEHAHKDNDEFHAEHDVFFAGHYESTVPQMTDEEKARMEDLGWFEDEESWATHC